ncbi:MAG: hypothetical protein COW08_05560, partial [Ignavibacteriales bacterium CG12_big_fil_rev_8_21_14_0_65_30_8]
MPKKINSDSSAVFFNLVKVDGVTWNAGIRNDDQLLKIDNIPIKTTMQAQLILNKFKSGDYADYTYLQKGKVINTKVLIKKLLDVGDLAFSLFGLIWFLIGYLVLSSKPNGLIQKLFYAVGAATILAGLQVILKSFTYADVYGQQSLPFVASISFFWSIGYSSLPVLVIYFFWVFPKP